jgi:carbamate kinase
MRIVAALGGNALLPRDEPLDQTTQRRNAAGAAVLVAGTQVRPSAARLKIP